MGAAIKLCDYKTLASFIPLNQLDADKCTELAQKSTLRQYQAGERIFRLHDETNHLFYLISGTIDIVHTSKKIKLKAGSAEASSPISPLDTKHVQISANTPASILIVNNNLLDLLLNWENSNGYEVDEINSEQEGDWVQGILQNQTLLKLPPNNIQAIMACIQTINVKAGQTIIKQGERDNYYYIISKGKCRVSQRQDSSEKETMLAELTEGDAFGEEALIAECTRNATITMLEDGLLLRLDHNDFTQFLKTQIVRYVSLEKAEELLKGNAQWIDVRPPAEHIKNGIGLNVPLSTTRIIAHELNKKNSYILYCHDGRKSAVAAFLLIQHGLEVYVLEGGLCKNNFLNNAQGDVSVKPNNLYYLNKKPTDNHQLEQTKRIEALHITHQRELAHHTKHSKALNEQVTQQKNRIDVLEKMLTENKNEIASINAKSHKLESELRKKSQSLDSKDIQIKLLCNEHEKAINAFEEKITILNNSLEKQQKNYQTAINNNKQLEYEIQSKKQIINEVKFELERMKDQQIRSNNIIAALEKDIDTEKSSTKTFAEQNKTLKEEASTNIYVISKLNEQIAIHIDTISNRTALTNQLKKELELVKGHNKHKDEDIRKQQEEIEHLKQELASYNNDHEIHKALVTQLEKQLSKQTELNNNSKLQITIDSLQNELQQVLHDNTALKNHMNLLKDEFMKEKHEIIATLELRIKSLNQQVSKSHDKETKEKQSTNQMKTRLEELEQRAEVAEQTIEVLEFQLNRQQLSNQEMVPESGIEPLTY